MGGTCLSVPEQLQVLNAQRQLPSVFDSKRSDTADETQRSLGCAM